MTEKPEAWWRPTTPEEAADLEKNQAEFKAQFGSFEAVEFGKYWLGASQDGQYLAFQFHRPDGSIHRFALHWQMVDVFWTQLAVAIDEMGQRQFALKEPEGAA